jgi:hypothetical protein
MNLRLLALLLPSILTAADNLPVIAVDWNKTIAHSRTSVSIQVCPEPPMRRGSPIHDHLFRALREAQVDLGRLQPWYPYPRLGVAELDPPKDGKTSWDFSLIDPLVEDFFKASEGRPVMLNFGTIPQWMFITEKPVPYPEDPDEIAWGYVGGTQLRDPSLKELVDYYHRLASWYLKGGFTDEYGKWHESGHRYKVAYWEVLNEVNTEHFLKPEQYTAIYDAIVEDLHKLDPTMKFSALALTQPMPDPDYFRFYDYFLNPKNHKPGVPLDMFSYHFYTSAAADESPEIEQHTIFAQADTILMAVRHIEGIRRRLAPQVKSYISELGSFSGDAVSTDTVVRDSFWTLSGTMFAYLYPRLVEQGVDYIGAAELIDYPGQCPSTTLVDWATGKPTARYWAMRLLKAHFGPGDRLAATSQPEPTIDAQGFVAASGAHKLLLVNKRNREVAISISGATGATLEFVDQTTGYTPPGSTTLTSDRVLLRPQMVAVITFGNGTTKHD